MDAAGILATNFMTLVGAMIDFECFKLMINKKGRKPQIYSNTFTGRSAITIFTEGKEAYSPQPSKQGARQAKEQSHCETINQGKTWLVKAKKNVTFAPRCRQVVMGKVEFEKGQ